MTVPSLSSPMSVTALEADAGVRLDKLLAERIDGVSRSRLQALIREGAVCQGARTIGDPGLRVKPGETYVVTLPEPEAAAPAGEAIALTIVHEDAHLIVIDKPAGLVVHPAAGHATGTLVNALIAHCGDSLSGIGGVRRPGIVHRLDKDTSGLLVVAKTDQAHQGLTEQFAAHGRDGRMHRRYVGVVWGVPTPRQGRIETLLARSSTNRTRIAVVKLGGRIAITHYVIEEVFVDAEGQLFAAQVGLVLETGRTHQIRVHMEHIGHPMLGDTTYGAGFKASARRLTEPAQAALRHLGRQALHAAELGFEHPATGKVMRFESPLPADMAALVKAIRGQSENAAAKAAGKRSRK
ncbi:MAG: RluA family pseudouridine synthase [Hyphomicrobiaceae bacterium]